MPGAEDSQTLYGYETLRGNPPCTDKPIRIISMEFCPFAERARIVAAKHGVDHDIINVSLSNKPEFLFRANPNGQVPALLHEGHAIFESENVVEYLENRFPETASLYPKDAAVRAEGRQLSSQHGGKVIPSFYKVFGALKSDDAAAKEEAFGAFQKAVDEWVEQKLGSGPFFGGATENITDILIYPWLNRATILTRNTLPALLPADKFPKTDKYVEAMRALPHIKATATTDEDFLKFGKSYSSGQKPIGFNIGSKHPFYAGPESKDA